MPRGAGCPVCESVNRGLLCPSCVNASVFLDEKRKSLEQLRRQRDALLQRLERALADKATQRQQELERLRAKERLQEAQQAEKAALDELARARAAHEQSRAATSARRSRLSLVSQQLSASRNDILRSQIPTLLRYQSLTLSHISSMLLREQRSRMRELLDIVPLRINALRPNAGGPIQTTVCNLRLPDGLAAPAAGWTDAEAEATSAAVGYLLLAVEKVALLMGGPLLHEGRFQGSTSSIWQPHSFWHREPAGGAVLPLVATNSSGSSGASSSAAASSSRSKATSYWGGGGPTLQSQGSIGGSSSNGDISTNTARSPCVDARRAYELLLRSLTCLLRDRAHALHLQLPANWPPHAWLVLFTAAVKRDAKGDGKLMAASTLASLDPAAAAAAAAAAGGVDGSVAWGGATLAGQQGDLMAGIWGEGDEDDEEDEGWGVVQTPFLPPPPSRPDEVEHWTRAMFTDASAAGAHVASLASNVGSPSAGGMLPMERIRSLFNKQ